MNGWTYITSRATSDEAWQAVIDGLGVLRAMGHMTGPGGFRGKVEPHAGAFWVLMSGGPEHTIPTELLTED